MKAFGGIEHISQYAIRRWRVVVLLSASLILTGWLAWNRIPRSEDPRVDATELLVTLPYPGSVPENSEAHVLNVLEPEIYGLEGIEWLESAAVPNAVLLRVKFENGTNMDAAAERVRGCIEGKRSELPKLETPKIVHVATRLVSQMVVAVRGYRTSAVLAQAAERLKHEIMTLDGVAMAELRGDFRRAVRVRLIPGRLAEHGVRIDQIAARLRASNVAIAAGEIEVGTLSALLALDNEIRKPEDLVNLPVAESIHEDGTRSVVHLGELAQIKEETRRAEERFLWGSSPAVAIEIRFKPDANATEIANRLRARFEQLRGTLPRGITLAIAHDQSKIVEDYVGSFVSSLLEGVVLVLAVLSALVGLRVGSLVALTLPLATACAVLTLFVAGFSLDHISIAGLIIALGLLVDDAIVVAESVTLSHEPGNDRVTAAIKGTARVFWANNGTTAVACAAFAPLLALGGGLGRYFRGMPIAVIASLLASLLVAQFVTPWLSTVMLRLRPGASALQPVGHYPMLDDSAGSANDEPNVVVRMLKRAYMRILPGLLKHPGKVVLACSLALVALILNVPRIGFEFFPRSSKGMLFVRLELPRGTSLERTTDVTLSTARALAEEPGVLNSSAVIGGGYPYVVAARLPQQHGSHVVDILVHLVPGETSERISQSLRRRLASIPGARVAVEELWEGPPVAHPVSVRVFGPSYEKLQAYEDQIANVLRATPGAINVAETLAETTPVAKVVLDPERSLRSGVTPGAVGTLLRAVYGNESAATFWQDTTKVDVVLEHGASNESVFQRLKYDPIGGDANHPVSLQQAGDVAWTSAKARLMHRNLRRMTEITADVAVGTPPSRVTDALQATLAKMKWDVGYEYSFGGTQEETESSFKYMGLALLVAAASIALLLVLIFDSFRLALVALLAVPFMLIGALGGLLLLHKPLSAPAFMGIIALTGIYVNHKIYFIDRMKELMRRGVALHDALAQAGIDRLRPVLLTGLTAILGMLPLTLSGGPVWAAFGVVSIFGLLISIPLSLTLVPALCCLLLRRMAARSAPIPAAGSEGAASRQD